MNASGPYDFLGKIMLRAHASVKEVRLLEKPKDFILVFGDGTELEPRREVQEEGKIGTLDTASSWIRICERWIWRRRSVACTRLRLFGDRLSQPCNSLRSCGLSGTTASQVNKTDGFPVILKPTEGYLPLAGI